jgi:3-hydroxyisobutyrate dehydrogenase-like beta-hydroxyacid dehydrogenase
MTPVVAVIAPGAMGAAVGKRLADNGVTVLTSLEGRSDETRARAKAAGMTAAKDGDIARADFILSILPPGDALALAQRFVPALAASNAKPVYVDCNAINPKTTVPLSMPGSSASRRSRAMPARASMRPAPRRRALRACASMASTSASSTAP